jgi:hypothetical protein
VRFPVFARQADEFIILALDFGFQITFDSIRGAAFVGARGEDQQGEQQRKEE